MANANLFNIEINNEEENERIDKIICNYCENISRSYIQKLIKDNSILVNDKIVKSNYKLKEGDIVTVELPESIEPDIEPENIPLDILYEDQDVLVVNKPKDMVVHPSAGHYNQTLVNALLYYCKGNLSGINGILRPGIVHRIDKDTTGSLIVCKNEFSHNSIAKQLKDHSVKRIYHAIVYGNFDSLEGTINAPIGRDPNQRKKMAINKQNGKEAITHFKVLKQFNNYSYIICQLETGRTHQIRVHMNSIGHPLLGDETYTDRKSKYKLKGQCLHAKTIGFIQPTSNEYIEIEAPLPEYFEHLLNIL